MGYWAFIDQLYSWISGHAKICDVCDFGHRTINPFANSELQSLA
jgi:hypothetical protein